MTQYILKLYQKAAGGEHIYKEDPEKYDEEVERQILPLVECPYYNFADSKYKNKYRAAHDKCWSEYDGEGYMQR